MTGRKMDLLERCVLGFVRDESGATAIEYAMIAFGIAVAIAASIDGVREALIANFYDKMTAAFDPSPSPDAP